MAYDDLTDEQKRQLEQDLALSGRASSSADIGRSLLSPAPPNSGPVGTGSVEDMDQQNAAAQALMAGGPPAPQQATAQSIASQLAGLEHPRQRTDIPRPDMSKIVRAAAPAASGSQSSVPGAGAAMQGGGAYPPATTTPAHWVNTMAPEVRSAMTEGRSAEMEGIRQLTTERQVSGEEQAATLRQARVDAQTQAMIDRADMDKQRKALMDHYDEMGKRWQEASTAKIDPTHFFASKTTAEKIALVISMALGSFGASLTHSQNTAGMMVQNAIDHDIEAQTRNIEHSREGLKNQQGLLADKWRLLGDKEKAQAAARQEMLTYADTAMKEQAALSGSRQAQAEAMRLTGQLQQQYAKEDNAVQAYKPASTTGGPPSEEKLLQMEKLRAEIAKTYADADKAAGGGAQKDPLAKEHAQAQEQSDQLDVIGKQVLGAPQTSATHGDVGNYITAKTGIQGTEGQAAKMAMDQWNSAVEVALHAKGVRLGNPQMAQGFINHLRIMPNDDAQQRREKVRLGKQLLGEDSGWGGGAGAPPAAALPASFRPAGAK